MISFKKFVVLSLTVICGLVLVQLALGGNQTTRDGFWAGDGKDGWNYASVQCVDGKPALVVNRKQDKAAAIAIFVNDNGNHVMQLTKDGEVRMLDLWKLSGSISFSSREEGPAESPFSKQGPTQSQVMEYIRNNNNSAPPAEWYPNGDPWRNPTADEIREMLDGPYNDSWIGVGG